MSEIAIRLQDVGKRFRIAAARPLRTLSEAIGGCIRSPFSAVSWLVRRLRARDEDFVWALRGVSFDVRRGEVLGVIGRNGAGKSTLLKVLSRITIPTEGRVELRGRVGSLLEVGTGFHPELSGRENIYLNGAILGMRRAEIARKFDAMVSFAEVEKFIDTPVKHYSSGMYLRLAFAVAAHLEPEILLVDEVLAVGDAAFQRKCLGKMEDVAGQGRTVLFVSHNMAAIRSLCGTALLLDGGTVVCRGPAGEVVDRYVSGLAPTHHRDAPFLARSEELDLTLRRFDLLDESGREAPALQAGKPGAIRLSLETASCRSTLLVSISISTLDDVGVCLFHTGVSGFSPRLEPPGSEVRCSLPKVPLRPGRYRVGIKCGVGGRVAFYLPRALEITVESGDFYGNGRLPPDDWPGVCLVEHGWEAAPAPMAELAEAGRCRGHAPGRENA
jgi:lipopolysaccharide transport system ATP-binding protein